jgi:hypothetical protein
MQKIGELPVTARFTMSKSRDVLEKNLERFLRRQLKRRSGRRVALSALPVSGSRGTTGAISLTTETESPSIAGQT